MHSRNCLLGRPDVFVPNVQGEWIHPDAATPEAVAELAHNCPSVAITYERNDGGAAEVPPVVNVVRVRENGPLAFHGELTIGGEPTLRATLCRCGASQRKPFCDGSTRVPDPQRRRARHEDLGAARKTQWRGRRRCSRRRPAARERQPRDQGEAATKSPLCAATGRRTVLRSQSRTISPGPSCRSVTAGFSASRCPGRSSMR